MFKVYDIFVLFQTFSSCAQTPTFGQPCRQYSSSSTPAGIMAADVPEGILLGIGNPLLDMTITANEAFLKKYDLEANNAIMAEPKHEAMFEEIMEKFTPEYGAGGATQNSIRVAQWLLGKKRATTFFGCVGEDDQGMILLTKAEEDGVKVIYQINPMLSTGMCGAIITGEDRSLVAHLGAANFFSHEFLESPRNWSLVQQAQYFYIGGFVFPVCTQSIQDVAKHACDSNKTLVMNLSAPFLCKYYANPDINIMPYVDILFGNDTEAATFCKLQGIKADTIEEMALETSKLPKVNPKRERIVIFTQGRQPTVMATNGTVTTHPIASVDKALIRDTNGCGDSFVGGFLSQLVQGKPISEAIRCGNYAASVVIKYWGCNYPTHPDFH